jgi:hypothetical protein
MYKILFNLRFKIDAKIFSFISNFINKSCRVWNLVSNKTNFASFGFFCDFLGILQYSCIHEITDTQEGGFWI